MGNNEELNKIQKFNEQGVRSVWDDEKGEWYFSVVKWLEWLEKK